MTKTIENKGKYNCTTLKQSISFQYFFSHVYFHTAMRKSTIIKTFVKCLLYTKHSSKYFYIL